MSDIEPPIKTYRELIEDGIATELLLAKVTVRELCSRYPNDNEIKDSAQEILVIQYDPDRCRFYREVKIVDFDDEAFIGASYLQNLARYPEYSREVHVTELGRILLGVTQKAMSMLPGLEASI